MRGKYIEFLKNCKIITEHYEYLVNLTKNHIFVGATNEWIIDNFYLIVETKNNSKLKTKISKRAITIILALALLCLAGVIFYIVQG